MTFSKDSQKFLRAFKDPIFLFLIFAGNGVLVLATLAVYVLEKGTNPKMLSYFDSLWWGVSTITTIGYGDIVPVTLEGRIIGVGLMYLGSVLFVLFSGALIKHLLHGEVASEEKHLQHLLHEINERLKKLEKTSDDQLIPKEVVTSNNS